VPKEDCKQVPRQDCRDVPRTYTDYETEAAEAAVEAVTSSRPQSRTRVSIAKNPVTYKYDVSLNIPALRSEPTAPVPVAGLDAEMKATEAQEAAGAEGAGAEGASESVDFIPEGQARTERVVSEAASADPGHHLGASSAEGATGREGLEGPLGGRAGAAEELAAAAEPTPPAGVGGSSIGGKKKRDRLNPFGP